MARQSPVKRQFGTLVSDVRAFKPAPFLKWAGGKGQLLDQMAPRFPKTYETYLEPFLGGGAVFFYLRPQRAILTDSNADLINAFRIVRDDPESLMAALDAHHPHRTSQDYYYRIRSMNPDGMTDVERAARTIFLNKTCYNGLYRVNTKGQFNVPFGKYKNPTLYERASLLAASHALRGTVLDVIDYRDACSYAGTGDFVYLDPPYQPLSATARFTGYTKESFAETDQKELAAVFKHLDQQGCKVILSNSATDFVKSLYLGYRMEVVRATRAINSKPAGRGAIDELLVMSY